MDLSNPIVMYITAESVLRFLLASFGIYVTVLMGTSFLIHFCRAPPKVTKTNIILEGCSGIGKTTVSDTSYDFYKYINYCSTVYKDKGFHEHVQSLYMTRLFNDLYDTMSFGEVSDRCVVSQFVYAILFACGGHIADLEVFKANVEEYVTEEYYAELHKVVHAHFASLSKHHNADFKLVFLITTNETKTAKALIDRNTEFEQKFETLNYIKNQNYLFQLIHDRLKLGIIYEVDGYVTDDDMRDIRLLCGL